MKTSRLPSDTFGEQAGIGESCWTEAGHSVREQLQYSGRSSGPSGHRREMSFLRRLMLYGTTAEGRDLEEKLVGSERKEYCAHRAIWWMGVLTAIAIAGLGHSVILGEAYPLNLGSAAIRFFCALGVAGMVSLGAFFIFRSHCRSELNEHREQCRRLVMRIVEARCGRPGDISAPELTGPFLLAERPEKDSQPAKSNLIDR